MDIFTKYKKPATTAFVFFNLITVLMIAMNPVLQCASCEPEDNADYELFNPKGIVVWVFLFAISFVILVRYGKYDEVSQKILLTMKGKEPMTAYKISKELNKKYPKLRGLNDKQVSRYLKKLDESSGIVKTKRGYVYCGFFNTDESEEHMRNKKIERQEIEELKNSIKKSLNK